MITLRPTQIDELAILDEMDRQHHAREFILQTGMAVHQQNFNDPAITYLCIDNSNDELCGYFILVLEQGGESVEFRRILIDKNRRGVGQAAIAAMESYCENELKVKRIWLDVFYDNAIGIHIYEKLGYARFTETSVEGRKLLFYEKFL